MAADVKDTPRKRHPQLRGQPGDDILHNWIHAENVHENLWYRSSATETVDHPKVSFATSARRIMGGCVLKNTSGFIFATRAANRPDLSRLVLVVKSIFATNARASSSVFIVGSRMHASQIPKTKMKKHPAERSRRISLMLLKFFNWECEGCEGKLCKSCDEKYGQDCEN
jgi:hypothetical protein